jgi:O-antigen/teichoic acid export membrane protein
MASFKAKLLKGFLWRLCLYVSSFLLNISIANSLGAEKSGLFYLLLNNLSFIVLFLGLGIDSAITYFASRKEADTGYLLTLSFVWSLIAVVLMFIGYMIAGASGNQFFSGLTPYAILFAGSSLLSNCLAGILYAYEDNASPSLIFTCVNIILILFLPGHIFSVDFISLTGYTKIFFMISMLPCLFFTVVLLAGKFRLQMGNKKHFFKHTLFPFAWKAFLYSLFYALMLRCDYWLIHYFCTDAALGNYMQATKLNQVVLMIPALASFTLFPLVVSQIQQEKEIASKIVRLATIYLFTGLGICMGIVLVGYWLFPWLYGNSFSGMYAPFVLLAPGVLALAAAYPFTTFFTGKNLLNVTIRALVFSIFLLLLLDLLLIPKFGIYGAAIAGSATYCFYFIYLATRFKKLHPFNWNELFQVKRLLKQNIPALFNLTQTNED